MRFLSRPGGVYYRVVLDPTRRYRIGCHGQRSGGPFILRLQRNDEAPVYTQAPEGVETFRVHGAERFELLLYRHYESDGESYLVRALDVEDCTATCLTDADLKQQIRVDLPNLDDALQSGDYYRAAVMLLGWASPRIPDQNTGRGRFPRSSLGLGALLRLLPSRHWRGVLQRDG